MTHTSESLAFLRAIAAEPDDDTPRLAYADYLDEHAGSPEQVKCECVDNRGESSSTCSFCRGTGFIMRPSPEAARAEFIRVQVELANFPKEHREFVQSQPNHKWEAEDYARCRYNLDRNSALLTEHETAWRAGPVCERCGGTGNEDAQGVLDDPLTCRTCHGTGDSGGLLRKFAYSLTATVGTIQEPVRVHFRRGFLERIDVPRLSDVIRLPPVINPDTGEVVSYDSVLPTPWASSLFLPEVMAVCPERCVMREIVPLDRVPHPGHGSEKGFLWLSPSSSSASFHQQSIIPEPVFLLLAERKGAAARYTTRDLAISALARTLCQFVRNYKE